MSRVVWQKFGDLVLPCMRLVMGGVVVTVVEASVMLVWCCTLQPQHLWITIMPAALCPQRPLRQSAHCRALWPGKAPPPAPPPLHDVWRSEDGAAWRLVTCNAPWVSSCTMHSLPSTDKRLAQQQRNSRLSEYRCVLIRHQYRRRFAGATWNDHWCKRWRAGAARPYVDHRWRLRRDGAKHCQAHALPPPERSALGQGSAKLL